MFNNCWTVRSLSVLTVAHIVLLLGVIFFGIWGVPAIIKIQIHKQTELVNGTDQWARFEELPFPLEFKVRFFNVTNPDALLTNNDTIPILNETKPYVYKLNISKKNITANDFEDSLTYNRSLMLVNPGYEDLENVSIVNPVVLTALQITNAIDRIALAGCMSRIFINDMDKMFITKTVRELVVDGINFAYENDSSVGVACALIRDIAYGLIRNIRPIELVGEKPNRYLRFSMFKWKTDDYTKPERPDGEYTVLRGRNDMSELGRIIRWNNSTEIGIWGNHMSVNNDTCKKVRGTDSTIFPPNLHEGGTLDNFNTDICRIVAIKYTGKENYNGIEGYRYETPSKTFWSETKNPENDCFCSKSTKNQFEEDDCYLDGVFDFKPCLGAPILVSFPHFKDAHPKYAGNITFVSNSQTNEASDFQTYLLLEPNTGIPLQGRIRVQMSSVFRPEFLVDKITPQNMSRVIIPILSLEESFDLPPEYIQMLNDQYFSKVSLATGLKYGAVAVIAVLLVVCVFFLFRKKYVSPKKNNSNKYW